MLHPGTDLALHSLPLSKLVHKTHHESYNPDPWSGLSMHPVESAVYFSAALCTALVAPLWVVRGNIFGLIVFPLDGHSGHGSWDEAACNHYVHHAKFKWNYGSSPLWDHICGTNYPMGPVGKEAAAEAAEQAVLSGCSFDPGAKAAAGSLNCKAM